MGSCAGKQNRAKSFIAPAPLKGQSTRSSSMIETNALVSLRRNYVANEGKLHRRVKSCYETVLAEQAMPSALDFKFVSMGSDGCEHLSQLLPFYPRLHSLSLWKSHIGIAGCKPLSKALASVRSLRSLALEDNEIRAAGLETLAPALKSLKWLEELYLHTNNLGSVGGLILASVLPSLPHLRVLTVDDNSLQDSSAVRIIPVLSPATTLLGLGFNALTDATMQELTDRGVELRSLKTLRVAGNSISEEAKRRFRKVAQVVVME